MIALGEFIAGDLAGRVRRLRLLRMGLGDEILLRRAVYLAAAGVYQAAELSMARPLENVEGAAKIVISDQVGLTIAEGNGDNGGQVKHRIAIRVDNIQGGGIA